MGFILIMKSCKGVVTKEEVRLNDYELNHIIILFLKPMVISCFWLYPSATPVTHFLSSNSPNHVLTGLPCC